MQWKIPLPPELVKGTLHDIVLGVSTQKVNLDAIESILIRLEESAGDFQGSESEVNVAFFSLGLISEKYRLNNFSVANHCQRLDLVFMSGHQTS